VCVHDWQLEALSSSKETIEKLQRKLENAEAVIEMKSESERLVCVYNALLGSRWSYDCIAYLVYDFVLLVAEESKLVLFCDMMFLFLCLNFVHFINCQI